VDAAGEPDRRRGPAASEPPNRAGPLLLDRDEAEARIAAKRLMDRCWIGGQDAWAGMGTEKSGQGSLIIANGR
jgi:hypothetical protein